MGSLRILLGVVVVAACGPGEPGAVPVVEPDPESFDPPPTEPAALTLEQTGDNTIERSLSLACSDGTGTTENSWYRVFALADFGIDGAFFVNRVNFGVQTAIGAQRVKVALGTYAGDAGAEQLDPTKIDTLALTTIRVPPTDTGEMVQANFASVEIPAGARLVVEVRSEGHAATTPTYFYLGATQATETIPGYLRAPACNTADPVMTSALGHVGTHLIIDVSGTH